MNTIDPIAGILPGVIRHLHERFTVNQLEAQTPTDEEIEEGARQAAETRAHPSHVTTDPDCSLCYEESQWGTRLDAPLPDLATLRQRHEISPDRFHDDFATVAANCGFCAEGLPGGEGGNAAMSGDQCPARIANTAGGVVRCQSSAGHGPDHRVDTTTWRDDHEDAVAPGAAAEEPHHRAARQPTDEERSAVRTVALESMRAGLPGLAAKAKALQGRHGGGRAV